MAKLDQTAVQHRLAGHLDLALAWTERHQRWLVGALVAPLALYGAARAVGPSLVLVAGSGLGDGASAASTSAATAPRITRPSSPARPSRRAADAATAITLSMAVQALTTPHGN